MVDLGDPIYNLTYQFSGGPALCLDAQDTNDDGAVNLADPIYSLAYLFSGGPPPLPPFADCGPDPTDDGLPGCAAYPACP